MSFDLSARESTKKVFDVLIPFEQGDVFRQRIGLKWKEFLSLNPFRAGRCLSTWMAKTGSTE